MIFKQKTYSLGDKIHFTKFIGILTGFSNKAKNLHWAAPAKNIHTYLDDLYGIINDFTDTIAEGYMGILGKMGPKDIVVVPCEVGDARTFIDELIDQTKKFYEGIPDSTEFKGITSETETFMQNCQKYRYLFSLCSNDF
jgi:hypothetical protein